LDVAELAVDVAVLDGSENADAAAARFSSDGHLVALAGAEGSLVWDTTTGQRLFSIRPGRAL